MLPDFMPNAHPLLVHFPIALLIAAVAVDLVALLARRRQLVATATALFALGAAAMIPTYVTGRRAGDTLSSPFPRADALAAEHADWAWMTLWAFLLLALVRIVLAWRDELTGWRHVGLAVVAVAALFPLYETAEHGGELVYDLGVGVRAVNEAPEGAFDPAPAIDVGVLGPVEGADGSLRWRFAAGVEAVLGELLEPLGGDLPPAVVQTTQSALVLTPSSSDPVMLLLPARYTDVRVELRVNTDEFDGSLALVHHVADAESYDFLRLRGGRLALGRRAGGADTVLSDTAVDGLTGWHELAAVGTTTHYRGYVDGELLVHDHTAALPAGRVGILIAGRGRLQLDDLRIFPLAE